MERYRAAVNMGAKVSGAAQGVTFMETASLDVFLLKYKIRFESLICADTKSPDIFATTIIKILHPKLTQNMIIVKNIYVGFISQLLVEFEAKFNWRLN